MSPPNLPPHGASKSSCSTFPPCASALKSRTSSASGAPTEPLAAHTNPVHGILRCFKRAFETWPDELVRLGCPLNNLTQEMTPVDASISERTQAVLNAWIAGTERYLRQAQRDGYLKKSADPRATAEFIVTLQEGTFAMGKALSDRWVFDSSYRSLKIDLDSISATAPAGD